MTDVAESLTDLKGVGPKTAEKLAELGLRRVVDVLFHLPLRYEDRTRILPLGVIQNGQRALVEGIVEGAEIKYGRRRSLLVPIGDGTGTVALRFFYFGNPLRKTLSRGTKVRAFGEARPGFRGLEIVHPEFSVLSEDEETPVEGTLTPVYPTGSGIQQATLRKLTQQALNSLAEMDTESLELLTREEIPEAFSWSLRDSLKFAHRPPPEANVGALEARTHPAQLRLAFEELVAHQLSVRRVRTLIQQQSAPPLQTSTGGRTQDFLTSLPFELTGAQARVVDELRDDLDQPVPMLRLVQGDVGAGKTVVAAMAILQAVDAGYQAAIMAPTEILAEQHLRSFTGWLEPLGVRVTWLSGKVTGRARAAALNDIAGDADVVVGTHALMQDAVEYRNLGLVVIDEQHRFGVHQRLALRDKGQRGEVVPHQLIMTATPIPRTLAMTAYADLDVSIIDELPPGRTPVETAVISAARIGSVVERVANACRREARQAYWVCTLVEESESVRAQAAAERAQALTDALPDLRVGLIHGRLKPAEKQAVMTAFKDQEIDLLVATTVIEVGVDVPNASLMVIENAERLGLSQLHQLRGRVGRGTAKSSCVLLYDAALSDNARERLATMRATNDGFVIAEKDLEIRGPGDMLGTRQTGLLQLRVADLQSHAELLPDVRALAESFEDSSRAELLIERWIGSAEQYAGA